MKLKNILTAGFACALAIPFSAAAQDSVASDTPADLLEGTVFDGDYLSVGVGVGLAPTYAGSDDYSAFFLPVVQGSYRGIAINPRQSGVAIDFINDTGKRVAFSAGPVIKFNFDRSDLGSIDDPIVEAYGELDTAVEVGPSVGVTFSQVLHGYDSISFNVDAAWDIASAHNGVSVNPTLTYFTPLSRGIAASLILSANWIDDDYAEYYFSVAPNNPLLAPADALPGYTADSGFKDVGANLFLAYDLNGDLTDGGLSLFGIGGYSRVLSDAKRTPFTSIRGDADQWLVGAGIGYTF